MVDLAERLERLFPNGRIADFAYRWKVIELAAFGSVLRDDFNSDSDVDVLVSFDPAATWSLWDLTRMKDVRRFQFSIRALLLFFFFFWL